MSLHPWKGGKGIINRMTQRQVLDDLIYSTSFWKEEEKHFLLLNQLAFEN